MYTCIHVFVHPEIHVYNNTGRCIYMYTIVQKNMCTCIQERSADALVNFFTWGYNSVTTRWQIEILYHSAPEKSRVFCVKFCTNFDLPNCAFCTIDTFSILSIHFRKNVKILKIVFVHNSLTVCSYWVHNWGVYCTQWKEGALYEICKHYVIFEWGSSLP